MSKKIVFSILVIFIICIGIYFYNSKNQIYNSIPKELARVNNTFKYSIVDKDARKNRYESSKKIV